VTTGWIPIALMGAGLVVMAALSAISTPSEKKKIVYIEKDLVGKKGRRKKKDNGEGGGDDEHKKGLHPTAPWGGL